MSGYFLHFSRKKKGKAIGYEKGIEQGIEKGIEKGIKKNQISNALIMLAEGMPDAVIIKITGLTQMELDELRSR